MPKSGNWWKRTNESWKSWRACTATHIPTSASFHQSLTSVSGGSVVFPHCFQRTFSFELNLILKTDTGKSFFMWLSMTIFHILDRFPFSQIVKVVLAKHAWCAGVMDDPYTLSASLCDFTCQSWLLILLFVCLFVCLLFSILEDSHGRTSWHTLWERSLWVVLPVWSWLPSETSTCSLCHTCILP